MRFSVGLWDSLFGEKLKLDLGNGQVRTVTRKWFEEMQRRGHAEIAQTVKVHTIGKDREPNMDDPDDVQDFMLGRDEGTYRVEMWTIGEQLSAADVAKYRDKVTNDLYVCYIIIDGKWKWRFVPREMFAKMLAVYGREGTP